MEPKTYCQINADGSTDSIPREGIVEKQTIVHMLGLDHSDEKVNTLNTYWDVDNILQLAMNLPNETDQEEEIKNQVSKNQTVWTILGNLLAGLDQRAPNDKTYVDS